MRGQLTAAEGRAQNRETAVRELEERVSELKDTISQLQLDKTELITKVWVGGWVGV